MELHRQASGRTNQKSRTRTAIVRAARDLLADGKTPTISEVAEAAYVSRATAYRYFPTQDLLLVEAALDSIVPDIHTLLITPGLETDVDARLDMVVRRIHVMVRDHEGAFRTLLRLSQDSGSPETGQNLQSAPRRGGRRVGWVTEALEPVADQLDTIATRRLVGALSLFLGIETRIVLHDICLLSNEESEDVTRWAARSLLRAALADNRIE